MAFIREQLVQNGEQKKLTVAIVGGGLVGSLEALFLAKRGYDVHLFEFREDIRKTPHVKGKSINLAMSMRGRLALREVGLEDRLIDNHGIPMKGRMIHNVDGSTKGIPYDAVTNKALYSVERRYLNEVLLSESEKYSTVSRHFKHKLIEANLKKNSLTFLQTDSQKTINVKADLIIGADGAFSTVRKAMMKQPLFDYSQTYIEHGYMELCIPATKNNDFAMPPNYLHIWPRGTFMMIALPNQDKSWTVTLFMPFKKFKELDTEDALLNFFERHFPDSISLIGKKKLVQDFFSGKPSALVSVKCRPYNVEDKALIIGDAAHALVPFYGQGMNAGFEDCTILDNLISKYGTGRMDVILEEFSETRWSDAHAISDLAMYNYIEMRDLVNKRSFLLRKKLDDFLYWIMPNRWVPLHSSVSFTNISYSHCVKHRNWQNKMLSRIFYFTGLSGTILMAFFLQNHYYNFMQIF